MKYLKIIIVAGLMTSASSAMAQDRLDDYPGFSDDKSKHMTAFLKEENARERFVTKCMKQKGHKYFFSPAQKDPTYKSSDRGKSLHKDKNSDLLKTLSAEDLVTYNRSLTGYDDPNDPLTAGMPTDGSCVGQSMETYPGVFSVKASVGKAYGRKMRDVTKRPELVALHPAWSSCMATKGFADAKSPDEFMSTISGNVMNASDQTSMQSAAQAAKAARKAAKACAGTSGIKAKYKESRGKAKKEFLNDNKAKLDKAKKKYEKQPKL